jgi:hypothetical protein
MPLVHNQTVQALPFVKMILLEPLLHVISMTSVNKIIKCHVDNLGKQQDMLLSTLQT